MSSQCSLSQQPWTEQLNQLKPQILLACTTTPVAAGPNALIKALATQVPALAFRRALCRGGWYRLGGVVSASGERISDNLEAWLEDELERHDGDFHALYASHALRGLRATRFVGRTHYFVAPIGEAVDAFVQLEIEDLQEVLSHTLFAEDEEAHSLEELLEPQSSVFNGQPIGFPSYIFRRITAMNEFLANARQQQPEPQGIHRFIEAWGKSSAGNATTFYNHWVLAVSEHLDRFHQPIYRAKPVPAIDGAIPSFTAKEGVRELALHDVLVSFDRQAGYPMAWFFHMLTTKAVPTWVARTVVEDALAGFAYLPRRDEDLIRNWLHKPYSV